MANFIEKSGLADKWQNRDKTQEKSLSFIEKSGLADKWDKKKYEKEQSSGTHNKQTKNNRGKNAWQTEPNAEPQETMRNMTDDY